MEISEIQGRVLIPQVFSHQLFVLEDNHAHWCWTQEVLGLVLPLQGINTGSILKNKPSLDLKRHEEVLLISDW